MAQLSTIMTITNLKTPKAASSRKAHKADVGWGGGGLGLVDNQSSVIQIRSSLKLHLPKLLQGFHYVY